MPNDKIRLIAKLIKDDDKFKSILFTLSAKLGDGRRVELIDTWMPRKQVEVRNGKELWASSWIIEQKEMELAKEKFDGEVVELATYSEGG